MNRTMMMANALGMMTLGLTAFGASAQTAYPEKPVRVVVPFPAGSGADISARIATQKLSELWARPVVVENVPGAAGSVAAERVAKSAPDGYTLLFSGDAAMTTNVTVYPKLAYDPLRDFAPIMNFVETPNILVVHPSLPVKSVKELVALAKSRPGEITYASSGAGTSQHLGGALLASRAGVDLSHVPYKDAAVAMSDVIGGRVTMFFWQHVVHHAAGACRKNARDCGEFAQAHTGGAGAADRRRIRLPGLQRRGVVRITGTRRHARGCTHQTATGCRACDRHAGCAQQVHRKRCHRCRQYRGGIRGADQGRDYVQGRSGQGIRRQIKLVNKSDIYVNLARCNGSPGRHAVHDRVGGFCFVMRAAFFLALPARCSSGNRLPLLRQPLRRTPRKRRYRQRRIARAGNTHDRAVEDAKVVHLMREAPAQRLAKRGNLGDIGRPPVGVHKQIASADEIQCAVVEVVIRPSRRAPPLALRALSVVDVAREQTMDAEGRVVRHAVTADLAATG